ncbi:MAG: hypothetical protein JW793_13945 [Acidobacteria bacterium]|nr:hypothetical protein [Acidobacteriota bacterium]
MKYFAAILRMKDIEKNNLYRPQHIDFLTRNENEGKIFARGRFTGGAGGLVIYMAESHDEAFKLAQTDPYVTHGARSLELYEWDMKFTGNP